MSVPPDLAIIPVGATEQHGPHLPVGTDTMTRTAYIVVTNLPPKLVVSPTNLDFGPVIIGPLEYLFDGGAIFAFQPRDNVEALFDCPQALRVAGGDLEVSDTVDDDAPHASLCHGDEDLELQPDDQIYVPQRLINM